MARISMRISAIAAMFLLCPDTATAQAAIATAEQNYDGYHGRSLLVDGDDTTPGRYPYHVQVGCCSGVLIAPDVVLSAAHDVPPHDVAVGMKVSVGAYHTNQMTHADGDAVQVRTVVESMVHPNYTVIHNDFALLVLDKPVELQKGSILKLNRNPKVPKPQQTVVILGTGTFNLSTSLRSDVLQEGTSKYLPTDECAKAHDPARGVSYQDPFLGESNLCTFGGADGCVFDSGAPIILKGKHNQENHHKDDLLLALVSYGVDCGDPIYPAVNARVSAGAPWINDMVCQYSTNPPKDFTCDGLESLAYTMHQGTFIKKVRASDSMSLGFFGGIMALMGVAAAVLQWKRRRMERKHHGLGEHQHLLSNQTPKHSNCAIE